MFPDWSPSSKDSLSGYQTGLNTSIGIGADDLPIIAFTRDALGQLGSGPDLRVAVCEDSTCSTADAVTYPYDRNIAGADITTIASVGGLENAFGGIETHEEERGTQIAVGTDGIPVIVKQDVTSPYAVSLIECGNAHCNSGNTLVTIDDGVGSTGGRHAAVSLAIRESDNARVVSYVSGGLEGTLKIAILEGP